MKKVISYALFIAVLMFAACTDPDTVDGNKEDGVFNGGHPARSDNHDSINNSNGTGKYVGDNTAGSASTTPNEAKHGNDADIHNDSSETNHNRKQ